MIDIVEVKAAIRSGKLSVQVKNGSLLMKDSLSGEAVKLSDLHYTPVVHAEWIDEIEPKSISASGRQIHVFRCSACDFTWANKAAVLRYFKFCPNCGARMDGEENA